MNAYEEEVFELEHVHTSTKNLIATLNDRQKLNIKIK